jgi:hypothetical protein
MNMKNLAWKLLLLLEKKTKNYNEHKVRMVVGDHGAFWLFTFEV